MRYRSPCRPKYRRTTGTQDTHRNPRRCNDRGPFGELHQVRIGPEVNTAFLVTTFEGTAGRNKVRPKGGSMITESTLLAKPLHVDITRQ